VRDILRADEHGVISKDQFFKSIHRLMKRTHTHEDDDSDSSSGSSSSDEDSELDGDMMVRRKGFLANALNRPQSFTNAEASDMSHPANRYRLKLVHSLLSQIHLILDQVQLTHSAMGQGMDLASREQAVKSIDVHLSTIDDVILQRDHNGCEFYPRWVTKDMQTLHARIAAIMHPGVATGGKGKGGKHVEKYEMSVQTDAADASSKFQDPQFYHEYLSYKLMKASMQRTQLQLTQAARGGGGRGGSVRVPLSQRDNAHKRAHARQRQRPRSATTRQLTTSGYGLGGKRMKNGPKKAFRAGSSTRNINSVYAEYDPTDVSSKDYTWVARRRRKGNRGERDKWSRLEQKLEAVSQQVQSQVDIEQEVEKRVSQALKKERRQFKKLTRRLESALGGSNGTGGSQGGDSYAREDTRVNGELAEVKAALKALQNKHGSVKPVDQGMMNELRAANEDTRIRITKLTEVHAQVQQKDAELLAMREEKMGLERIVAEFHEKEKNASKDASTLKLMERINTLDGQEARKEREVKDLQRAQFLLRKEHKQATGADFDSRRSTTAELEALRETFSNKTEEAKLLAGGSSSNNGNHAGFSSPYGRASGDLYQANPTALLDDLRSQKRSVNALRSELGQERARYHSLVSTSEAQKMFMHNQLEVSRTQELKRDKARMDQLNEMRARDGAKASAFEKKLVHAQSSYDKKLKDSIEDARLEYQKKFDLKVGQLSNIVEAQELEKQDVEADMRRLEDERALVMSQNKRLERMLQAHSSTMDAREEAGKSGVPTSDFQLEEINNEFWGLVIDSFKGDYLNFGANAKVIRMLLHHDDKHVVFSDFVRKVNRRNGTDERVLLLSDCALYVLVPGSLELKRRIPFRQISSTSLSRLQADVMVLHHKQEYDLVVRSSKRTELMYHLQKAYRQEAQARLPYKYGERLFVEDKDNYHRQMNIVTPKKSTLAPRQQLFKGQKKHEGHIYEQDR
jgi:hypothetical protein